MKAAGIIAEYNPFHNGHAYQLAQVRRETGADCIVIAMSGDFVQRGAPAVTDKYTRAQMALLSGADLVFELPAFWSVSSAQHYARAGVHCLAATGIVDRICYGCESTEPELVSVLCAALCEPTEAYRAQLKTLLRGGKSYPLARQEALCAALPDVDAGSIRTFLSSPNNILALEYEKAIAHWNASHAHTVHGHAIRRVGDGYHSAQPLSRYASATALRRQLLCASADGLLTADDPVWELLSGYLPQTSLTLLQRAAESSRLMDTDDFSGALYASLLSAGSTGYAHYADATEALSGRIARHLGEFISFTQFAGMLKTREVTHTRILRVLTHILLGFAEEDAPRPCPFLRLLGFRKSSAPMLHEIRKKASVPLITKVADASRTLSNADMPTEDRTLALHALAQDIRAADIYRGIRSVKSGRAQCNEYTQPLVILP